MKFVRNLILLFVVCFAIGYSGGVASAQAECILVDSVGSCVGGECTCWSVTNTCGQYSCSSSGGSCAGSGGVSISWTNGTTCNF